MRPIHTLIWHCTATPAGREVTAKEIDRWHKQRGWSGIGYHLVVHLDGSVSKGRPIEKIGAHVAGKNTGSIGYVYVGGVDKNSLTPKDTRTKAQRATMLRLTKEALAKYRLKRIAGHNEFAAKACPSFHVPTWLKEVGLESRAAG
jgi:N-acetylmuramoyl-L-alanine amidase